MWFGTFFPRFLGHLATEDSLKLARRSTFRTGSRRFEIDDRLRPRGEYLFGFMCMVLYAVHFRAAARTAARSVLPFTALPAFSTRKTGTQIDRATPFSADS